jgi:hypothetical protein
MARVDPAVGGAKTQATVALAWIIVAFVTVGMAIGARLAYLELTMPQIRTMLLSFAYSPIAVYVIARFLRGFKPTLRVAGTLLLYLVGCWMTFNLARYSQDDFRWGWAHAPGSWSYFAYEFALVLWHNRNLDLWPAVKAFLLIAIGINRQ